MTTTFRTHDGRTLQQAASDLVQREVLCCMSSMVSTLISGMDIDPYQGRGAGARIDLHSLCNQAAELAAPMLDYEAGAAEAGWFIDGGLFANHTLETVSDINPGDGPAPLWVELCEYEGIEPHEIEVYEHWAVSTWLAEKLQAAGERVDTDFAGLNVWARTTTGQAISIDAVIERITREMHAPVEA